MKTHFARVAPVGLLAVATVMMITGCGFRFGPHITVKWRSPKPGLVEKTPVRYAGAGAGGSQVWVDVGEVTKVGPDGTTAEIGLFRKTAHYVTTRTTFLFRPTDGTLSAFVEVRALDKDAPPVQNGAILDGSESDLEAQARKLVTDWRQTSLWIGGGLLALLVLLLVAKLAFHFWALLVCLAGGAASAIYFHPMVENAILPYAPQGVRPDILAYVAGFLAGYLACMLLLALLRAPLRIGKTQ